MKIRAYTAAQNGREDIIKLLLKRGVSKKAKNSDGETALDVGKRCGKTLCAQILEMPFGSF